MHAQHSDAIFKKKNTFNVQWVELVCAILTVTEQQLHFAMVIMEH